MRQAPIGDAPTATPSFWRSRGTVNQFLVVGMAGILILTAPFAHGFLPARFVLDSNHIRSLIRSGIANDNGNSFNAIANLYRSIGLGHTEAYVALFGVGLFVVAIFLATPFGEIRNYGIIALSVVTIGFACSFVYLTQYSKEALTLIPVITLMVRPTKRYSEIVFISVCTFYAAFFREYWIIVILMYILLRIALPRIRRVTHFLGIILAFYLSLELFSRSLRNEWLSTLRTGVNEFRSSADVQTIISSPIPMSGVLSAPAGTLVLILLVVPVPLALHFSFFHALSAACILLLWICVAAGFAHLRIRRRARLAPTRRDNIMARAAALLLAFVMVQAVFEPDYGSYLKHLTPLLPVFLSLTPLRERSRCNNLERACPNEESIDSGPPVADTNACSIMTRPYEVERIHTN